MYKRAPRSKEMKTAYRLARAGKWEKAAKIWDALADDEKEKIAARARFNLALASEQLGELDTAIEWVNYSDEVIPKRLNDLYLATLEMRVEEEKILAEQLARVEVAEESNETEERNEEEEK